MDPDAATTLDLDNGISLDLEVRREDGRIHAFGAVRVDTGESLTRSGASMTRYLRQLDRFVEGSSFLLGHNLIAFDLPHLVAVQPDLKLSRLPAIDTLRLSPLAFPRNPYHHLVKHYQDGGLKRRSRNDPELDARLALDVFRDQREAFAKSDPNLLAAWHWLTTPDPDGVDRALNQFLAEIRQAKRPSRAEARAAMEACLADAACRHRAREAMERAECSGWVLAYALSWLSVAGGNSVMPPWVRHQFPGAGRLVRLFRDTACTDPECSWCRERHDARKELRRWFGFDGFRPEPSDDDGNSLQQSIVETAMAGEHVFATLPTGAGKSLCYQVPALSRYDKTGALTVVISPLVALMADQVAGLEKRGVGCCVTINGLLSMPERADALDRVRLGDVGILLVSPEQLRSRAFRKALAQREIGGWVLDEAHCLSRWGHDFRPDYLYVCRFIRERSGKDPVPPVLCLTATAKPDVEEDILRHFRERVGIDLKVFNGGAERTNLSFEVMKTTGGEKLAHIHQALESYLPPELPGGAIVYCATRSRTEEVAEFLRLKEMAAAHFHAGLPPETKKDVQTRFIGGDLDVIAATNAFGMGIDKPDVRLVIHADIPGSLENYLQEAGRAGRDRRSARCVLFYDEEDVERQFGMSARSRLTRREIHGVLRALRNLDRKKRLNGEVVATVGEILGEDDEYAFERDSTTDDTRLRTAVSWLEEAELLTREENHVQLFPSSLRVDSLGDAKERLRRAGLEPGYLGQLLSIAETLLLANADEGVSTDELMLATGLSSEGVRQALYDLERCGIASNDTELTAFVHVGVARGSRKRYEETCALETALIGHMRELAPDMGKGDTSPLHLRHASQTLRDKGLVDSLPERLWRMVRSISHDGRGEDDSVGSLFVQKQDAETVRVKLKRSWAALERTAEIRRQAAGGLLSHLVTELPRGSRGTDLLAKTTIGRLTEALESDLATQTHREERHPRKLLDRALLWLHEQEIIRLNKGMAVFRPAMTIRLSRRERRRGFSGADFEALNLHYRGQVLQIHVMVAYAKRGLQATADAIRLAMDYFCLGEKEFLKLWLPGRNQELRRQITPESWRNIVESLRDPVQQRIVADNREQTNVLVLAGPGSGKTRVLVHRIAYLVRARREKPRSILALAYNRHAAVDIRRQLRDLVGDDSRGVTVLTCHALAMRLAGASFLGQAERPDDRDFDAILKRAIEVLSGEGMEPEELDEWRERLLGGFRWILVDEYQDIGAEEYQLISAIAGRTLEDPSRRLSMFAVGDDDQNIYAFKGASVEYIRRIEADYDARPAYLTGNYRSTRCIVSAANAVIHPARERMKAEHPIRVNRKREKDPPGGVWQELDPVGRGRVQILTAGRDPVSQAQVVVHELKRLEALSPTWDWSRCAVIAREWKYLDPVRACCQMEDIPAQLASDEIPRFWRLRETQALVKRLRSRESGLVDSAALRQWMDELPSSHWTELLRQAMDERVLEAGNGECPVDGVVEWLAEWGRDAQRRQKGLLLQTAHRAKGLEFDHIVVLDGGWGPITVGKEKDPDEERRLYYVAMTRARETLALVSMGNNPLLQDVAGAGGCVVERPKPVLPPAPPALRHRFIQARLRDVDLSYAGRRHARDPVHDAIASLSSGDPLSLKKSDRSGIVLSDDRSGIVVGRLSKSFRPPAGMHCLSASVLAVVWWYCDDSRPEYQKSMKCDSWEVVVPELVFGPGRG